MAKIAKVNFNPNKISANPEKSFYIFTQKIMKLNQQGKNIDLSRFSKELYQLGDSFEAKNQKELMNKKAKKLAETLVAKNDNNMAGIIYSFLIKFNQENTKLVEEFATSALAIAKRLNDPMHVMARCNDLKEIYKTFPPKEDKLLKVLYEEKRALNKIITDYDNVKTKYNTINRQMKPVSNYRILLADIKFEIGKQLTNKDEKLAMQEIAEARAIYEEYKLTNRLASLEEFIGNK